MNLKQLELFLSIAETGSFSAAAERARLTQPTVTSHIQSLEEELGSPLFERLPRESRMTAAGKALYPYARDILSLQEKAVQEVGAASFRIQGTLTISASTVPAHVLLPSWIANFHRLHPQVHFNVFQRDSQGVMKDILERKAQVGILGSRLHRPEVKLTPLCEDELVILYPGNTTWKKKNLKTLADLEGESFINREDGSGTALASLHLLEERGLSLKDLSQVATFPTNASVIEGVRRGLGWAIVSRISAAHALKEGWVQELKLQGESLQRHFYLAVHQGSIPSPTLSAFIDAIFEDIHSQK